MLRIIKTADGAFVLSKKRRTDNEATLDVTGRDQQNMRLTLTKNPERLVWELNDVETELWKQPPEPLLEKVEGLLTDDINSWSGTPTELCEAVNADMKPNTMTLKLNVNAGRLYDEYGIKNTCSAKKILDKYMHDFEKRNPNLRVFSAHLHMDEATPHLHIDFVSFTTSSKRGLETRVSLKKALEAQGFKGGSRSDTEWNQWVASEKEALLQIMLEQGIEWDKKGMHEKHKSVSEFKREKRVQEVEKLTEEKKKLERKIATYKGAEDYALRTAKKLEKEFKVPEPSPLMLAKTYKTKFIEPLVGKLIKTVVNLARRCSRAEKEAEQTAAKIKPLKAENEELRRQLWQKNIRLSKSEVKA